MAMNCLGDESVLHILPKLSFALCNPKSLYYLCRQFQESPTHLMVQLIPHKSLLHQHRRLSVLSSRWMLLFFFFSD